MLDMKPEIGFNAFCKLISESLTQKIEKHNGLSIFAQNRAKFEAWLKVELCDILSRYFSDLIPEKDRIDVTAGNNWAIELKTVNTNYQYEGTVPKTRPITKNIDGVLKDIAGLRMLDGYRERAVIFIVFPVEEDNSKWKLHLNKISDQLSKIRGCSFRFVGNIPGVIYIGLV